MALLPICLFPHPILRKKAVSVDFKDPEAHRIAKDLSDTLYAQPHGIGIAAPQVGEPKRVIIVDVSFRDPSKKQEIMLNPLLIRSEGEAISREGCMSIPDYTAHIKRALRVWARWQDPLGKRHERLFSGIEAICLQHEVDHLNGMLFIDRVTSLKTDVFPREEHSKRQRNKQRRDP